MDAIAFYHDAALTQPVSTSNPILSIQTTAQNDPVVQQLWLGALDGITLRESTNPGVNPIQISIVDALAGSGETTAAVKLALTQAGLATAVAGDPLSVGTELVGGAANAIPFWISLDDVTGVRGDYDDLSLLTSDLVEV